MPKKTSSLRRGLAKRDSLNNPAVPLSAAGFFAWAFGGEPTAAGELVTAESAFKQVTVLACVRVLADGIASLPLKIYRLTDSGKQILDAHPTSLLLAHEPNDEMTPYSLMFSMVMALVAFGKCFVEIQRGSSGLPLGLWPLHPACTHIRRDSDGNLYFETTDTPDNKVRRIEPKNMIYVPYMGLTGVEGMSLIGVAKEAIGLAIASEKFGSRFFGNNATPNGILVDKAAGEVTPEQQQLFKQSWNQAHSGTNQHKTGFLWGQWEYVPIGTNPQESQFVELRSFQRAEIAALFNVPPSKIGDTSKQSKASATQENLSFVIDTLRPIAVRLEQEMVRKLFPGQNDIVIEADFSERLRGDFVTTMQGISVGRQWGILTANDGRKILDMNPLPGKSADITWAPVNMQNAEWMLDTESIQDQPVGADPQLPAPAQPEQKSRLQRLENSYALLFRDSMGRTIQRAGSARQKAASQIFEPVIRSLAAAIGADEKHVDSVLGGLAKRAAKWTETDADGPVEFRRVVRTLHLNAMRDKAAKYAEVEIDLALPAPAKEKETTDEE
jgi:HK97 family phage portal protein